MIITENTEHHFINWLINNTHHEHYEINDIDNLLMISYIIEWFETFGVIIGYQVWECDGRKVYYFIDSGTRRDVGPDFKTINEALTKGIELANKLFNEGKFNDISTDNIKV